VDWEIQASLRNGNSVKPNGLLGIKLPSYDSNGYPERLNANLKQDEEQEECYARAIDYPTKETLIDYIEDAFNARESRKDLIVNKRDKFSYNRTC